jgi:Phage endonuclease I
MGRTQWRVKGKRSGLEQNVGLLLLAANLQEGYEESSIKYSIPESIHTYTPDFRPYKNKPIYLETKGRWEASDRKKMKLILEQHTNKTFIMIFGRSLNTITKKSKTTYGDYCDKIGLLWCDLKDFSKDPKACLSRLIQQQKSGLSKPTRRKRSTKSLPLVKPVS